MPECLARFDWRDWRPPALPGDPFPYYVEWYLATIDHQAALDAWMAGEPVVLPPERPLPDPIPYTGLLPSIGEQKPPQNVPAEHKARTIRSR